MKGVSKVYAFNDGSDLRDRMFFFQYQSSDEFLDGDRWNFTGELLDRDSEKHFMDHDSP